LILELGLDLDNYHSKRGVLSTGQIFFWAPVRIMYFTKLLLNLPGDLGQLTCGGKRSGN